MEHADSDTNIKQSKSNHLGKLALICSPWNRTMVYRSQRFCPDTSFSLYHQENHSWSHGKPNVMLPAIPTQFHPFRLCAPP